MANKLRSLGARMQGIACGWVGSRLAQSASRAKSSCSGQGRTAPAPGDRQRPVVIINGNRTKSTAAQVSFCKSPRGRQSATYAAASATSAMNNAPVADSARSLQAMSNLQEVRLRQLWPDPVRGTLSITHPRDRLTSDYS